jgi:hypothetical protein
MGLQPVEARNCASRSNTRFRAAVLEGKGYADRGEFIEEEEMDARFEQMLRS